MQIPLNQFEQCIDDTILKRGLSYFKNGHVHEHEEISPGRYEVKVEGSQEYTVQYTLKASTITEYVCDCPYDLGPVCKHMAAVVFYLQQDELEFNMQPNRIKSRKTAKPAKRKTVAEQINEVLEKATHEELKEFVSENALTNASLRNLLLSSFANYNSDESKELYTKQLKSILNTAADRHGYIDWSAVRHVAIAVYDLLDAAQMQLDINNYKSAIYICTAVMEQMIEAFDYSDDSNGDIGGCIEVAFDLLNRISQDQPPEEIRVFLLNYCIVAFDKQIYSDWDWHIGVLHIAARLISTEEEAERIVKRIDKVQAPDYERNEVQNIKYEILLKTKGELAADEYLEQNISNSIFRREAIQKALLKKNYEKAISLATDGVNYDKKDKPGLAMEWYDWLLKIAQAQNNNEKIIEYSRLLLIENFRNDQDYYQILKEHVNPENWIPFVEGIIKDISIKRGWIDSSLTARIFIKEEWWDRLLEFVKKSPSLYTIEEYEKYLSKDFSNELVDLYAPAVIDYIKQNTSRKHYQNACRYIRKMINLGGRDKANKIISLCRAEYPRRKALMEELNKI